MEEVWKDIKGLEGFYQVSNFGRVRRCFVLKPEIRKNHITDYTCARIGIRGKHYSIHRLVAQAFIPNPYNKAQVNHKDGNPLNNNVKNLEWATPQENTIHAINNNLKKLKIPLNKYKYVCNQYLKGRTMKEIGDEFSVNSTSIRSILIKNNIKIRKKGGYEWQ